MEEKELKLDLRVVKIEESDMEPGKIEISGDSGDGHTIEFLVDEDESKDFYFGLGLEVSIKYEKKEG